MKIINSIILSDFIRGILRTGLLLFMCAHISVGHISQYLDCLELNEIELAENNGKESKEKENKEEIDKDEYKKLHSSLSFLNQKNINSQYQTFLLWNCINKEIPTPPPRFIG